MPVKVNEFVIQAQFDEGGEATEGQTQGTDVDIQGLKEEIIKECMEKMEMLMDRRENR